MSEQHMLARCPFCNGHRLTHDVNELTWNIRCFDCQASGPVSCRSLGEAVHFWNAGAPDAKSSLVAYAYSRTTLSDDVGAFSIEHNRNQKKDIEL